MLQINDDKLSININSEEQLVAETIVLLKEIKQQLMFAYGKKEGKIKFESILEVANM